MKTMRLITVAAALLALTAIQAAAAQDASTTQPAGPGAAPQPATVAVCDMAAVFKNYDRANDLNKKLKSRVEELKAEAKKRGDEIDKIQNTIEELKPGSKESDAALDKMTKLTIERQAWINFQDELAKREDFRLTKDLYDDVLGRGGKNCPREGLPGGAVQGDEQPGQPQYRRTAPADVAAEGLVQRSIAGHHRGRHQAAQPRLRGQARHAVRRKSQASSTKSQTNDKAQRNNAQNRRG